MARIEAGHLYLGAFRGEIPAVSFEREAQGISPVFAQALAVMVTPSLKQKSTSVFMSGRAWEQVRHGELGQLVCEGPATWPDEMGKAVEAAGFISRTGLDFELHDQDPYGGAGKAKGTIACSPFHLIEGTKPGGVRSATIEEARWAASLGHAVGLVLSKEGYQRVIDYLTGKTEQYPIGWLPPYWLLGMQRNDFICGYEGISAWLEGEGDLLRQNPRAINERSLDASALQQIFHFYRYHGNLDERHLIHFEEIVRLI